MSTGPTRIAESLAAARSQGRAALLVALPLSGRPLSWVREAVTASVDAGADMVEFAVRYHFWPDRFLAAVKEVTCDCTVPVILWVDEPTIAAFGFSDSEVGLVDNCVQAGISGIAGTVREDQIERWADRCAKAAIAPIYFATPGMDAPVFERYCRSSQGFVYGVGVQAADPGGEGDLASFASSVRRLGKPIVVGAGVSGARDAAIAARYCDGVAVAGAVSRTLHGAPSDAQSLAALTTLLRSIAGALDCSAGEPS